MYYMCLILLAMAQLICAAELRGGGGGARQTTVTATAFSGAAPPPHDYSKERPDYFEQLRRNAVNVTRIQNVDVVETEEGETYGFCHIPYFYFFSHFPVETEPRQVLNIQGPLEGEAAVYLAMKHLNTGDGSVIPEVEGLNETCNIRFTFETIDTEFVESTTLINVLNLLDRDSTEQVEHPCAFLGAGRSSVTMPMSIITGIYEYPQMSGISTSHQLDDRSQYKYFSRLIPSDDGTAIPFILYLKDIVKTEFVSVIHTNNPYSNAFRESLQKAAIDYFPTLTLRSIDIPLNHVTDQDLKNAVTFLRQKQYRYIIAIIDGPTVYTRLMTEAYNQGIAGDDYVWIFTDSLFFDTVVGPEHEPDSPLAVAGRGSSMLLVYPGLPGSPTYESFLLAFHELNNPEEIEYLQSKHPQYEDEPDYQTLQFERIFVESDPSQNAVFLYDSTIAMGLAACAITDSVHYFDGPAHYEQIVKSNFTGASGKISINPTTGSRDPSSAYFELVNFVERTNPQTGKVFFDRVQTDVFKDGAWESVTPYIYGDGTSNIPGPLPPVDVEENHIDPPLVGIGLGLAVLVMLLSIGFAAWTIRYGKSKVVRASQPIFLLFTCSGVFIMASAIIPLSIDDKYTSEQGSDVACMATPWLFFLGFAFTFAALFSKTWRVNKLFHSTSFHRMKVTAFDVMIPLFILLFVNVTVLSLWSGLAPLKYMREVSRLNAFRQVVETKGQCYSEGSIPYIVVLTIVNIGGLVVAAYQAYCARKIAVEFAESAYIARAIALFLLACLYGMPVLAITWDEPSARYFVMMAVIFVCSMSVLLCVFVPKVLYRRRAKRKMPGGVCRVSGLESVDDDASMNESSESSDNFGAKVALTTRVRESTRMKTKELQQQSKELQERLKKIEQEGRNLLPVDEMRVSVEETCSSNIGGDKQESALHSERKD